jgi:hypothetical protein
MNKKSNIFISLLIGLLVCTSLNLKAQEVLQSDTIEIAQFYFESTEHDFGDVNQGETVEYFFDFKNSGNIPLIIQNVLTTCGCTAPEWPKIPIQAGESDQIKVVFDSSSKIGRQNKVITIRSNADAGDFRLRISAMVLPSKKK